MDDLPKSLTMGNSLVSFTPSIGGQRRADVLDCLLYAQLMADQKYDRKRDWKRWMEKYQKVIYERGGQIKGGIDPVRLRIKNMWDLRIINHQFVRYTQPPELQMLLRRSIDTLMESDHAKIFFKSWFVRGRSESMQVIPCADLGNGEIAILICGLQMTTRISLGAGWDLISREMELRCEGASFHLSEQGYAPFRDEISKYLAQQAGNTIVEL